MILPNFIIIGPGKTGSTSLWHYLRQHPDVFMSSFKEPGYFWTEAPTWKTNRVTTLQDYADLFKGADGYTAVGEASPTYFADEGAPERIKSALPNCKLIALLRDPRSRAFSDFVFQKMRDFETADTFLEAIEADRYRERDERVIYLDQGLYFKHLSRFLSVFPREQLLVLLNEDMKDRTQQMMAETFEFLGVDPDVPVDTSSALNPSGKPRSRIFHKMLSDRNPVKRAVSPLLPEGVRRAGRRIRDSNLQRLEMSPEDRRSLRSYFQDDIRRLEGLLNRDLSRWLED